MAGLNRKILGEQGERLTITYLKKHGYRILTHHFCSPAGEIDIIASKGDIIAFIEVKTRTGLSFGEPAEAVSFLKQRRLSQTALWFFNRTGREDFMVRFDVASVTFDVHGRPQIELLENAFEPGTYNL